MVTARITFRRDPRGYLQPMADGKEIAIESCVIHVDRDGVKASLWIDLGREGVIIEEPPAPEAA